VDSFCRCRGPRRHFHEEEHQEHQEHFLLWAKWNENPRKTLRQSTSSLGMGFDSPLRVGETHEPIRSGVNHWYHQQQDHDDDDSIEVM
jgi:hypothetical protein